MGEDDFGGDVGGMRLVDNVLPSDFMNERFGVAASKFNVQFVARSIDPTDADHSLFDSNEEVAVAFFPPTGEC